MARLMGIVTHHKGGTVWIKRVIRALSTEIGVPWTGIWSDKRKDHIPSQGRAFLCNWSGWLPKSLWQSGEFASLHVVRDPRDILLSGCAYHQTAGPKGERFLHEPRADLAGRTYQEHLLALRDPNEQLMFEMENKHAVTMAEMRAWPWGNAHNVELRYEDLMQDRDGLRFGDALTRLGLAPNEVLAGIRAFIDNSLFGGLARQEDRQGRLATHIRSGGKLQRWRDELPAEVGRAYARRFGGDLIALGYETDDSWVDTLLADPGQEVQHG